MIVSENAPLNESRLPSLDGWRAISIGLVLVQHSYAQPGWPKALDFSPLVAVGGVGVRFFFVISGFLITWLLLKEHQKTGRVSLKAFYVRRCLRILPIYLVYLICTAVIQSSGPLSLSNAEWLRAITFTVNFGGAEAPLGHLWTLGVEEQFYLLWPFLVAMFCGIRTGRLVTCLILPVIACPVLRFLAQHVEIQNPILNLVLKWHSFFTVCDGLAIGCLGAVAFTFHRKDSHPCFSKNLCSLSQPEALSFSCR